MADKQQTITVNFKYNTAEVTRGEQIVNRANEANNRLQQSAEKAGQGISNSFRSANQSIGAMQIQLARLKTQIEVSTNPQRVKQLSDQYKQLKTDLDKATKAAFDNGKALKQVQQQTGELSNSMGQLGAVLKGVFTVAAAKQIVDMTLNMEALAGRTEGVERAFNRAFPNSNELLINLKNATHGAVSELELMQRTLQATNLGVNVEQLPILFEFAAARAQQTGESVDYLVDSIVRGIGRKSILVLDNLGLSATRLKEQFNGASLASQSVADVTRGVAAIAKVELEKMGGYVDTAATRVDNLSASWENFKKTFSKTFADGSVSEFLQGYIDTYTDLIEATRRGITVSELRAEQFNQEASAMELNDMVNEKFTDNREKNIQIIKDEIANTQILISSYVSYRDQIQKNIAENERLATAINKQFLAGKISYDNAAQQVGFLRDQNAENQRSLDIRTEGIKIDQEYFRMLQSRLQAMQKEAVQEKETTGIIERKKEEIQKIQEAIEKTNISTNLSDRLGIGKLITDLAVAQAELKELLEGPENKEFNVKFNLKNVSKQFEELADLDLTIPVSIAPPSEGIIPMDYWDHLEEAFKNAETEIITSGIDITSDLLKSAEEAELAALQNRMNNLRNFYDEQILLAGDNERAKQQLRLREEQETAKLQKRMAEREKRVRMFNVVIDTAASIAKTAAQLGFPAAIPFIAIAAATGLAQLATISRTAPRFAKGVIDLKGPGTGTSDSIDAKLSRGESVMTAKETQKAGGILRDIRARKLDDKVLEKIKLSPTGVSFQGMDDSRIVKEIQALKRAQPDIVEQSGRVYKVYSKGKDYRQKVRVKSMGS